MAVHNQSTTHSNLWDVGVTNISNGGIGISSASIFSENQYAIQGRMLTTSIEISDLDYIERPIDPVEMKKRLMEQLVEQMFQDKSIEFTKIQDMTTGAHRFHARIYVVPDTQVRILRENKVATSGLR